MRFASASGYLLLKDVFILQAQSIACVFEISCDAQYWQRSCLLFLILAIYNFMAFGKGCIRGCAGLMRGKADMFLALWD